MFLLRYIINMCIFLPIILGLFVIVTKLSANQYSKINRKKYIQVLEKTMISKDVFSLVIRMGDSVYAGILSPKGFESIKELDKEEITAFDFNSNKNLEEVDYMKNIAASFDKVKPCIQTNVRKIKSLLNKISKERY